MIKTENLSMVFTTEEVQTKALNEVNIEAVSYTHLTLPTT